VGTFAHRNETAKTAKIMNALPVWYNSNWKQVADRKAAAHKKNAESFKWVSLEEFQDSVKLNPRRVGESLTAYSLRLKEATS
tara:strand:+ start:320 stop:565 length:246 start_codon:yes stop_codon:yes gene_type:complete